MVSRSMSRVNSCSPVSLEELVLGFWEGALAAGACRSEFVTGRCEVMTGIETLGWQVLDSLDFLAAGSSSVFCTGL